MDICLYRGEIGTCPLSFARMARTFADFIHSSSLQSEGLAPKPSVGYFAGTPKFI